MASSMGDVDGGEISCDQSTMISVQELSKDPKITIPENYIRLDEDPLAVTMKDPCFLPIIDMKRLNSAEATKSELEKLHSACKQWGMFQLVNHGVGDPLLNELKHEIQEFFELPLEEKMKLGIKPGEVEGYGTVVQSEAQKLDWGDRIYMKINPVHWRKFYNLLPVLRPSLRKALDSYIEELRKLAMELVKLMGVALKMKVGKMEEIFEDGIDTVRMNYYPPCTSPELVMGFAAHSDSSALTLLNQLNGVEGLQVKRDGLWFPLNLLKDAFVVNLGDVFEILSNGVYKSIEHRAAVNTEKERISVAVFFSPNMEAEIGPADSLINSENPPLYKTIGMQDYVKSFFSRRVNGKSNLEQLKIRNVQVNK